MTKQQKLEIINRSSHRRCSVKKVFLEFSQACNFIKIETLTQVFSCEFCEISKNTFFTEHIWVTASESKAIMKVYSKAMASHKGRDLTYSKSFVRFCWHSIYKDVESYIKACQNCQNKAI